MKNQTLFIILGVAAAGVIAWILMQKKKAAAAIAPAVDNTAQKAADKKEQAAFKELIAIFRKWAPNDLAYMLPFVDEVMNGEREIHSDYLVKGKVTLPGAFVAIFDASWKANQEQWQEMHNAFNRFKIEQYGA